MPFLEPHLGDISSLTVNRQLNHSVIHVVPRANRLIVVLPGRPGQSTRSKSTGPKLAPHCTEFCNQSPTCDPEVAYESLVSSSALVV